MLDGWIAQSYMEWLTGIAEEMRTRPRPRLNPAERTLAQLDESAKDSIADMAESCGLEGGFEGYRKEMERSAREDYNDDDDDKNV